MIANITLNIKCKRYGRVKNKKSQLTVKKVTVRANRLSARSNANDFDARKRGILRFGQDFFVEIGKLLGHQRRVVITMHGRLALATELGSLAGIHCQLF